MLLLEYIGILYSTRSGPETAGQMDLKPGSETGLITQLKNIIYLIRFNFFN